MFIPLLLMLSGIALGFLVRRMAWHRGMFFLRCLGHILSPAVLFLLFALGASVGGDAATMQALPRLGTVALWLTCAGLAGSFACVAVVKKYLPPVPAAAQGSTTSSAPGMSALQKFWSLLTGSWGIVGAFCVGLWLSIQGWLPPVFSHDAPLYILYVIMTLVGISLGKDERLLDILRSLRPGTLLLPLATAAGTLLGTALASLLVSYSLWECLAVGSGFVYYSLSSVLITMSKGPELGTIALVANLIRELTTFAAAPLLVRFLGPESLISCGGASTMDSSLPTVTRYAGPQWAFVSIVHALMLDMSVPFLVSFFCWL